MKSCQQHLQYTSCVKQTRVILSRQQLSSSLRPPDVTCGSPAANPDVGCSPPVTPHFFKFCTCLFFALPLLLPPPLWATPLPSSSPTNPPSSTPDPLAGATPPIGRSSRCVRPLSLMTTSRARRATWRTPSRAPHALRPLIRGTARTGTPLPTSQHASLYFSALLLLLLLYTNAKRVILFSEWTPRGN